MGSGDDDGTASTLPAATSDAPPPQGMRYQLGAQLGRGGMGEVISARDEQIGRAVAIKRMREANPDARTTARFFREARIQGQLEHPAIVPVHELSHDAEGRPFFAMKQLAGVTLADVIGTAPVGVSPPAFAKFPRLRLLRAFADVCLAIEFAHHRKIIHRDLKPANIMLGDFGEVYVLDWGIARRLDDAPDEPTGSTAGGDDTSTIAGSMIGTPGYMSPEQIHGDADIDARADIYALGCILFELLAREPLHPRGKAGLEDVLTGTPADRRRASVRAPDRDVPPELDAICVRATEADRGDRFATARELSEAVERYLDGDRDLALRRELARRELAAAKSVLDGGLLSTMSHSRQRQHTPRRDEIDAYASAMRAAGRALALDPKSHEAAEVVGRMMLEPPAELPPEVETKLTELEDDQLRLAGRFGVRATIGYFMFFPIMWVGGLRDSWLIFGGIIATLAIMLTAALIAERPSIGRIYLAMIANCALIAIYARGLTPYLVAPGVALLTTMLFAAQLRMRPAWVLWLCSTAAVLVPMMLERIGVLSTTTSVTGRSTLSLELPTTDLDSTVAIIGLGGYVVVILAIATIVVRSQALEQQRSRRSLQIQSWKLDQLVKATA